MTLKAMDPGAWERLRGESSPAFAAFSTYREMGPARSLIAAYRKHTGRVNATCLAGTWKRWTSDFEWEARAKAFDDHLARVEMQGREEEILQRAAEMERRRSQGEDDSWALYEALKKRVEQMLSLPVVEVLDEKNQRVIRPAKWDYSALAKVLDAMGRLLRIGADMDSAALDRLNIDWHSLTDDQIDQIASGESVARVLGGAGLRPVSQRRKDGNHN